MSTNSKLREIFKRWGGGTAFFFTYTHLSHDLCTSLLPAFLPLIKEGLGLSYLQSGFLLSALNVTSGLSQFPGGWLGDIRTIQIGTDDGCFQIVLPLKDLRHPTETQESVLNGAEKMHPILCPHCLLVAVAGAGQYSHINSILMASGVKV